MLIISSTATALTGADLDEGADAEAVISMFYIGSSSIDDRHSWQLGNLTSGFSSPAVTCVGGNSEGCNEIAHGRNV